MSLIMGARPTPINSLVTLYKNHNKSSLDFNHLVCNSCITWLTKPVYLIKNGHVCGCCAKTVMENCVRNMNLEVLLEGGQYPCKFYANGCTVFDALIEEHENKCNYNVRCYCQKFAGNRHNLIEHLKDTHSMETIQLVKPVADISLKMADMKNFKYYPVCLQAGETNLIIFIQLNKSANHLSASVCNGGDIPRDIKYIIKISCDETDYIKHGKVSNNMLEPTGTITVIIPNLDADNRPLLKFKIYFDNYQNFEPSEKNFESMIQEYECPICLETIIESCYQCDNGHNVCPNCAAKISVCPICRQHVNAYCMNIRNLTAQIQRLCKYSTNGCFLHNHIKEIQAHETVCPMKLRSCDLCKDRMFDKAAFFDHMASEHEMQTLEDTPAVVNPGYILYRGSVFKFGFEKVFQDITASGSRRIVDPKTMQPIKIKNHKLKVTWFLRLIEGQTKSESYNYKLKIEISGKCITINSKLQKDEETDGICFPFITTDAPVTLRLSFVDL